MDKQKQISVRYEAWRKLKLIALVNNESLIDTFDHLIDHALVAMPMDEWKKIEMLLEEER